VGPLPCRCRAVIYQRSAPQVGESPRGAGFAYLLTAGVSAEGVLGFAQPEPLQLSCTGSIRVPLLPALNRPRRSFEGCRKLLSAANTQLSGIAKIATAKNRVFIVPTFSNKATGRSMIARRFRCTGSGWGGNNPVQIRLLHWRSAATKLAR
jgi:hypothetical protein